MWIIVVEIYCNTSGNETRSYTDLHCYNLPLGGLDGVLGPIPTQEPVWVVAATT